LVVVAYVASIDSGRAIEHGRAMALVTLSCASATVTAMLSGLRTAAARAVALSTVALAFLLVQLPTLAERLHLGPLHATDWLLALAGSLLACLPLALSRRPPA
jgi:Ca2+-transporting ATPase